MHIQSLGATASSLNQSLSKSRRRQRISPPACVRNLQGKVSGLP